MYEINKGKELLTEKISDQFSKNIITMEEYERLLEYINKIETINELVIVEKVIQENHKNDVEIIQNMEISVPRNDTKKHLSMFSWRTSNVESVNGFGGTYTSLFGANRIIVDTLPRGKTVICVNSIFGLTEIIAQKNIKIVNRTVPLFAGIFAPDQKTNGNTEMPELHILGKAVFGNITIRLAD